MPATFPSASEERTSVATMEGEHRDAMMEAQHTHFLSIIREGIRPRVGLEEGLRALYVAEAMIRSTYSGSWEPVQVRD